MSFPRKSLSFLNFKILVSCLIFKSNIFLNVGEATEKALSPKMFFERRLN